MQTIQIHARRARPPVLPVVPANAISPACAGCPAQPLCPLRGLRLPVPGRELRLRVLHKGEYLFRMGDPLRTLTVVRRGCLMSRFTSAAGATQVLDFHPRGQVVGIDAIGGCCHPSDAVALDAAEVCELSVAWLLDQAAVHPVLQRRLMQLFSQRIARNESMLLALGKFSIEARLAAWLLEFERAQNGPPGIQAPAGTMMLLPMTRQDLGDHLGTTIESISRILTRFQHDRLIEVHGRQLRILARERLRTRSHAAVDADRGN